MIRYIYIYLASYWVRQEALSLVEQETPPSIYFWLLMAQVILCLHLIITTPLDSKCEAVNQTSKYAIRQIYTALNPEHAVALAQASSLHFIFVLTQKRRQVDTRTFRGYLCIKLESQLHMYKPSCIHTCILLDEIRRKKFRQGGMTPKITPKWSFSSFTTSFISYNGRQGF